MPIHLKSRCTNCKELYIKLEGCLQDQSCIIEPLLELYWTTRILISGKKIFASISYEHNPALSLQIPPLLSLSIFYAPSAKWLDILKPSIQLFLYQNHTPVSLELNHPPDAVGRRSRYCFELSPYQPPRSEHMSLKLFEDLGWLFEMARIPGAQEEVIFLREFRRRGRVCWQPRGFVRERLCLWEKVGISILRLIFLCQLRWQGPFYKFIMESFSTQSPSPNKRSSFRSKTKLK